MKGLFDSTIGVLEQAIKLRSKRNSMLAGNIANVDTPGYRPRDMKFRKLMESYMEKPVDSRLTATDPHHLLPHADTPAPAGHLSESNGSISLSLQMTGGSRMATTDPRHFSTGPEEENRMVEISTEKGTPNSVDLDREMAKLSANNLQYQADVSALIKKFEGLMTAITEGGKQ